MGDYQVFVYLAIFLYLLLVLYIGYLYSKGNKDAGGFYLGDRKLGPIVTAMSAEASDMSSWLLMGIPGLTFICGIADTFWTCLGLALGTYINWLLVAQRLRRYSEHIQAITLPDFFSRRFHDKSNFILAASASIIIIFFIPYTASGFAACGKLFSSLFGISYFSGMLLGAAVIVAYTALGGFMAASITDLIQSIIMSIAIIGIMAFGIEMAGGLAAVDKATGIEGYISITKMTNVVTGQTSPYGFITILSTMAWGLGYFGMPHILLRFMAIRDEKEIPLSRRIATTWVVIAMGCAIFIGVVGFAMTKAGTLDMFKNSAEAERLIIQLSHLLSTYGIIPAFIAGLVLAGILACTMSTADSQLLAAASSVSVNFAKVIFGVEVFSQKTITIARMTILAISALGVVIASNPNSSIFQIVSFAWAGFGASFGPLMLFSLFWKRTNRQGAIAGIICGGSMVFLWKFLIRPLGGVFGIYELLPAFIAASLAIYCVSIATEAPSKEIIEEFESIH